MVFEEPRARRDDARHDRGLRAGQGRALRRPRRDGPGSPVEALKAGANMPARMPRRLVMLLCLPALAAGAAACGEADVEQGVEEPAREGLASSSTASSTTSSSPASSTRGIPPDNAYVEAGTEPEPGRDAVRSLPPGLQPLRRARADRRGVQDRRQPGQRVRARGAAGGERVRVPRAGAAARRVHPRGGQRRPARAPRPARCCCSGCRSQNTEYRPLELEVEGKGDEHLTFELDI